jgi:hypothetical protein
MSINQEFVTKLDELHAMRKEHYAKGEDKGTSLITGGNFEVGGAIRADLKFYTKFFKKLTGKTYSEWDIICAIGSILIDTVPGQPVSKIIKRLEDCLERFGKPLLETFAFPANIFTLNILTLFTGNPRSIPRNILEKPFEDRTEEERKEVSQFLQSIIETDSSEDFGADGKPVVEETKTYLLSDNPKVRADAQVEYGEMFSNNPAYDEEALALWIKRTFGAEGLRHMLGLMIGLEESGRKGAFDWEINEHLERLGYKRHEAGAYRPEAKKVSSAIVQVFTSLIITAIQKADKTVLTSKNKLFNLEGWSQEKSAGEIIRETVTISATSFWYKNSFEPKDNKAAQYTKLLKKIATENHRNQPLTIYLAPLLAVFWRMDEIRTFTLKSLMRWCDLDYSNSRKFKGNIRKLEAELNYMVAHGYMGEWKNDGEKKFPSECKKPLDCVLTLKPPVWLASEIELIKEKREKFVPRLPEPDQEEPLTKEELNGIREKSGLTHQDFANHIGTSKQRIHNYVKGTRQIPSEFSTSVRQAFPDLIVEK